MTDYTSQPESVGRILARLAAVETVKPARPKASRPETYGLLAAIAVGIVYGIGIGTQTVPAVLDFRHYWLATNFSDLYPVDWLQTYAYVYPPPLAQLLYPFHVLPELLVTTAWIVLCFWCLWYCVREWTIPLLLLGVVGLIVSSDILAVGLGQAMLGNVNLPIAAAIVAGLRHPGWWAVPLLSKSTIGVGVLWFAFRGEWRRFGIALGVTAAIFALSYAIAPGAWREYVEWTIRNYGGPSFPAIVGPPLPLRLAAAVLLIAYGARTNRPWLVPIACGLAQPGLYGLPTVLVIALGASRRGYSPTIARLTSRRRWGSRPSPRPRPA